MTACSNETLKRTLNGAERVLLMLPLHVVMVARIQGAVDAQQLAAALDSVRKRHALLAVRVVYSDVNEKTLGVVTVGNTMTFLMSYNEATITPRTAEAIRDAAMRYLARAVKS